MLYCKLHLLCWFAKSKIVSVIINTFFPRLILSLFSRNIKSSIPIWQFVINNIFHPETPDDLHNLQIIITLSSVLLVATEDILIGSWSGNVFKMHIISFNYCWGEMLWSFSFTGKKWSVKNEGKKIKILWRKTTQVKVKLKY